VYVCVWWGGVGG